MIKISTSILSLSPSERVLSVQKLNNTNTDYIHIDVMDNIFVPNYQLPLEEVNNLGKYSNKPFDIHLMVEDPEPFIKGLTFDNIDTITIHVEIKKDIDKLIDLIKSYGYHVGLAINPKTDVSLLERYLTKVDKILVMSVEPGFGKQPFIETTPNKIIDIIVLNQDVLIEVDGGVNNNTISLIDGLSDIVVVGSYITSKEDYQEAINNIKN